MIISHKHKYIFVCPRKVASTSVRISIRAGRLAWAGPHRLRRHCRPCLYRLTPVERRTGSQRRFASVRRCRRLDGFEQRVAGGVAAGRPGATPPAGHRCQPGGQSRSAGVGMVGGRRADGSSPDAYCRIRGERAGDVRLRRAVRAAGRSGGLPALGLGQSPATWASRSTWWRSSSAGRRAT